MGNGKNVVSHFFLSQTPEKVNFLELSDIYLKTIRKLI